MRGVLNVVIRKSDGKVFSFEKGTNYMPYFLTNMKFFNADESYIDDFIKKSKNKVPIAPLNYGMILIDYMTKTLLSSQGYCSMPDMADNIKFLMTVNNYDNTEKISIRDHDEYNILKEIWEAGLITDYICLKKGKLFDAPINKEQTFDEFLLDLIKKDKLKNRKYFKIRINTGWNIIDFGDGSDYNTLLKLYNKITDLGIVINNTDINEWDNFLKYDTYSFKTFLRKHKIDSIIKSEF